MSLLVAAAFAAGGFALGRALMRRNTTPEAIVGRASAPQLAAPVPSRPEDDLLVAFPCQVGDVVMRPAVGEAWLAGALVFHEDAPVAALFIAPDAGGDRGIYVHPAPSSRIAWLLPVTLGPLGRSSEPPTSIEHTGAWFERRRRLPVRVTRVGSGAPSLGDEAIVAEYEGPGCERLLIVTSGGASHGWRGELLADGTYDLLPGERTASAT